MKIERKLITGEKAIANQCRTRIRMMESGGSWEDWKKLVEAQIDSNLVNYPWKPIPRLVTYTKAYENTKSKDSRDMNR